MSDAEAAAARLWLDAMHAIGRPLAHEVKNALNGLAVNLEVVRARTSRPDAPASGVARFADAAAGQLEVVTGLTEGLLAMVRPAPATGELAPLVERLAAMLRAVARPDGGTVAVTVGEGSAATALGGAQLRPIVAALLVGAFDRAGRLSCEIVGGDEPALHIRREGDALPEPADDVRAAAAMAGVRLAVGPECWTATFPARAVGAADPNSPGATNA